MLPSLLFTVAVVSLVPARGQFRGLSSISGGNCDRWIPVTREQCPMAYINHDGIESPFYNICNDDALGKVSVDEVVPMHVETAAGVRFTCRNAHACVGCPAFAPLLRSCPLLGSEGIGFVGATPGEGQEPVRVEAVGATRGNSYKRKRRSSGSAKRKRSTKGEKEDKLRLFKIYDMDNDGYISNGELYQVLKMMVGTNLKDTQLQQIVDRTILFADKDQDGRLSFEEFTVAVGNMDVPAKMVVEV